MKLRLFLTIAALACAQPASAESFRCGQWIVSEDSTADEVLEKCGPPTDRQVEVVDVYGPATSGAGRVKRGETRIETWTYDRGSQSFRMVVKVVDGKVESMERG